VQLVSLGFLTDLALLRLGGTHVDDRGDFLVVRSPHNPTYWWGNFLLLGPVPAPEDSQRWLDQFARAFPQAGHVAIGFNTNDGDVDSLDWFAARGFRTEQLTVMTATEVRPPKSINADAVYRRLHSDEDWAQSVELRLRCADEATGDITFERRAAQTHRAVVDAGHGAWFGAFVAGRLVCQMGLFRAGGERARFQSVETDPDFRRRGLAGSLVLHAGRYGSERLDARTLVMVADPDYIAIDLYRSVGFEATETQLRIERPPAQS